VFKKVVGKLGNMRKSVEWTVLPMKKTKEDRDQVLIQCERRIARVDLKIGTATLSDGKASHPGFITLSPGLGATTVPTPPALLEALRKIAQDVPAGPVVVCG
jgi:hypothetical protein